MTCGPCKESVDCLEIDEDDEEYEALNDLYKRLFEPTVDECSTEAPEEAAASATECDCLEPPEPSGEAAAEKTSGKAADYCETADESPTKRADRRLMALLRQKRDGGDGGSAAQGDVKHLTDKLPVFRSCKNAKPGAVNAALFGLNLEHWMTGTTAGDGQDDGVKRAAYDLSAAEAYCKYAGSVEAAELAVHVEPAANLAEVAARFGAQSYASSGTGAANTGQDGGDDSPVVVVAYVGSTAPESDE